MIDISKLHRRKKQSVVVTNNMREVLYFLLSSVKFEDGSCVVEFSDEAQVFMDSLNEYDIIDCHYRLDLPNSCGPGIWKNVNSYILNKVKKRLKK